MSDRLWRGRRWSRGLVLVLLMAQLALASCSLGGAAPTPTVARTPTPLPPSATLPATSTPPTPSPGVATATSSPSATASPSLARPATPATPLARGTASPGAGGLCVFPPPFPSSATPTTPRPVATAPRGTPPVAGPPAPTPPTIPLPALQARYSIAVDDVRFETGHLRARETVRVTNREPCALDRLYFSVTVARWGWFTLDGVAVAGQPTAASVAGTVLPVVLTQPLAAAATLELTFTFQLDVGVANDPFTPGGFAGTTRAGDILRLAYWFPILSDDHQYPPFLDPPYTATADYAVTLTLPATLVVAHTGVVTSEQTNADGTVTRRIDALNVRDFVLSLSPDYQVARRTAANGVTVEVYYSPLSLDPSGQNPTVVQQQVTTALDAGVTAIERFSALIGPYPYPVFRIVDGGPRLGGGIEFPMLVTVNLTLRGLAPLVYHETAHQWLYGILGTRTQQDPWIDEGGASFLAAVLDGTLPVNPPSPTAFAYRLDVSVWVVPPGPSQTAAYRSIYDQGEAFYQQVHLAMGDEAFWRALQALYRDDRFAIVTPRDLLMHWQAASPVDLRPLFRQYLDYPWIDELGR